MNSHKRTALILSMLIVTCAPSLAHEVTVHADKPQCEESIFGGVKSCTEKITLKGSTSGKKVRASCVTTWEISYQDGSTLKTRSFQQDLVLPSHSQGELAVFYVRQNIESVSKANAPKSVTTCQINIERKDFGKVVPNKSFKLL